VGGFSDNVEDAVLNQVLRGTPYGIPLAQRISLHHHDPDPYGGNEIAGAAYTRRPALWAEASGGVSVQVVDVSALVTGTWNVRGVSHLPRREQF